MSNTITKVNPMNLGSSSPSLTVPCIKYISGNREWYAIALSYKVLGKFITTSATKKKNQEIIKSDLKNRFLDPKHKNDIKQYIMEEEKFTIPPVTLVSYDRLDFRPFEFANTPVDPNGGSVVGVIVLPIDYEFECLDGNHRTVAIRELASEAPEYIADSNLLLNIVFEQNPLKIRQDFVDVNKNAKQTTSSINTLFNTREKMSGLVVQTIENNPLLKETTELLATTVSKNSKDIYTINNVKNAVIEISGRNSQAGAGTHEKRISEKMKEDSVYEVYLKERVEMFFEALSDNAVIKKCLLNREKTSEIRNDSVITSGTGLIIAARLCGLILKRDEAQDLQWVKEKFVEIMDLDWSRRNAEYQGNIVTADHKIVNSREAITNAVEILKERLELSDLTDQVEDEDSDQQQLDLLKVE